MKWWMSLIVFHVYICSGVWAAIWTECSLISQTAHFLFKHTKTNVFDDRGPFLMKTYSVSGSWAKWDFVAKLWTPKKQTISWNRKERGEKNLALDTKSRKSFRAFLPPIRCVSLTQSCISSPECPLAQLNRKWEKHLVKVSAVFAQNSSCHACVGTYHIQYVTTYVCVYTA